jgi:hypothetical protein
MFPFDTEKHSCVCGRSYLHRSGLSRHQKSCKSCDHEKMDLATKIKDLGSKKMVTTIFTCDACDYTTSRKSNFIKHKMTRLHNFKMLPRLTSSHKSSEACNKYSCICGKQYKYELCLHKHERICKQSLLAGELETDTDECQIAIVHESSHISEIKALKRIVEAQNVVIQRQGDVLQQSTNALEKTTDAIERSTDTQERLAKSLDNIAARDSMKVEGDNNRVNINKINIQVFLKEQCKDALNLEDFVNSLEIHVGDLEYTREKSLEDSVRQVFMKGLKQLEVNQRPIHCTDVKRETMYIKNKDSWDKQSSGDRETIRNAVKNVANRQRTMIKEWESKHPGWDQSEKGTHEYLMLIRNVMSDIGEDSKEENRIIKSIAKEVAI